MQKLPLLPLLPLRHGRQVVVYVTPEPLQILIRTRLQLDGFDAQIPKSLGVGVDDLIDEFALDEVRVRARGPEEAGEQRRGGLADEFGDVEDGAFVQGFAAGDVVDFLHGVFRGAVELVGLGGGGVVL